MKLVFFLVFVLILNVASAQGTADTFIAQFTQKVTDQRTAYRAFLAEKTLLIEQKNIPSLSPIRNYLATESAFVTNAAKTRVLLTGTSADDVTLKRVSASLHGVLMAEQQKYNLTLSQLPREFELAAKKTGMSPAQILQGSSTLKSAIDGTAQTTSAADAILSDAELKVTASLLPTKTAKVHYLKLSPSASLTGRELLVAARQRFPDANVSLFGPSHTGGKLEDYFKTLHRNKGIDQSFPVNAGWNMQTGVLRLPSGSDDFAYADVARPAKSDAAYVWSPSPGNPPSDSKDVVLIYFHGDGDRLRTRSPDYRSSSIIVVVDSPTPQKP